VPAADPAPGRAARLHLAVLVLLCGLAAALGRPVIGAPSTRLFGSVTEDGAVNYWNTWHLGHALSSGQSPFLSEQIFAPMGTNLAFHNHTVLNAALCALLEPLTGPLAAYNLSVLLTFVLCGYGMFLLARRLTGDDLASAVAGLLFAFCTFRVLRSMAHLNIASNQFLPFYVLLLLQGVRSGRWPPLLGAGALLAATGYASYYNLGFALAFSGLYAGYLFVRLLRQRLRPGERRLPFSPAAAAWRLAVIGLVGAALLAPLTWYLSLGATSDTVGFGCHGLTGLGASWSRYGADLLSFVLPMPYHPLIGGLVPAEYYFDGPGRGESAGLFLGCAVLLLAGVGLWLCRGQRRWWLWMGAGLAFLLISLGGALRVGGHELLDTPLARWLSSVPLFGGLWTYSRWSLPGLFCFTVAAAYAMSALRQKLAGAGSGATARWPRVMAALAGLAVACDLGLVLMHIEGSEVKPPAALSMIRDRGGGAVLDLPVAWEYSGQTPAGNLRAVRRYMFNQTVHQRPMVAGFAARGSAEGWRYLRGLPFLSDLITLAETKRPPPPASAARRRIARRVLWLLGVEYVLVHKTELSATTLPLMVQQVQRALGATKFFENEELLALRVPRRPRPPAVLRAGGALPAALLAGWRQVTGGADPHVCASPDGPRPQLLLRADPPGTTQVTLRLRSATGVQVTVLVNGERQQVLEVGRQWQDHALQINGAPWRGGINRLKLEGARGVCLQELRLAPTHTR